MKRWVKNYIFALVLMGLPVSVLAYFYGYHGEFIYMVAFVMGMYFQSKGYGQS